MPHHKFSAAEIRRQRAQLSAEREAGHVPLPPTFVAYLHNDYQPAPELRPLWPQPLLAPVEQILDLSNVRGDEALRKYITHLAHYLAWRHDRTLSLDPRDAMNRPDVDEYTRTGMPDSSDNSRSARRSRLRQICDTLNRDEAPSNAVVIPYEPVKPPYGSAEIRQIVRAIQVQRTPELVRQLCLCVGLGAGAGIDSPHLKLLDTTHVIDHGDRGIEIRVPGKNERTVWVLRDYEALVRRGLDGLRDGRPLIGRVKSRRNVAGAIYADAVLLGSLPRLEQSRLRSTWLATLMTRPVPLAVILTAAGLKSARTLFDLLPHLQSAATHNDADVLRNGGAA